MRASCNWHFCSFRPDRCFAAGYASGNRIPFRSPRPEASGPFFSNRGISMLKSKEIHFHLLLHRLHMGGFDGSSCTRGGR
jgi:hypothetical protein